MNPDAAYSEAAALHRRGQAAQDAHDYKAAATFFAEALKLYRLAGEGGHVDAQLVAGIMYSEARGTPADYTESTKWFRMAAERGNDEGQYMLGFAYFTGRGIRQNFVRAYQWLTLAARTGYDRPNDVLPLVLKRMTPAEMSEAEALVKRWKPSNWKPRRKRAT